MSCPVKFRAIGDFHSYYSGSAQAPYLTLFVGGNHEASSYLWELYYGGWVAPNIYYMGAANVLRLGGVRIAGLTGIWKGYNFKKPHYERLPYNQDDIKSVYHVREIDVRKLLQLRTQVDICISHDWPRAIEKHGDERQLFRMKPDFERESRDGTLGNPIAAQLMDRLRPPHWFAAHLHCKFAAVKNYKDEGESADEIRNSAARNSEENNVTASNGKRADPPITHNADEIDLDMDDDDDEHHNETDAVGKSQPTIAHDNNHDIRASDGHEAAPDSVSSELRAQLPAAFSRAPASVMSQSRPQDYRRPPEVKNKTVRFLALDKCLPGRKFLQILEVEPYEARNVPVKSENKEKSAAQPRRKPAFEYDPEWLAITRVFAPSLVLGDRSAPADYDLGEAHYLPLIQREEEWIEENVVKKGKLEIPENFEITAPAFQIGMPEIVNETPREYTNPQTQRFCDLIGIENKFQATEEERDNRMRNGPPPSQERNAGSFGGRNRGGGSQGRGRGRGRGGRGGRGRW